jgi:DNA-binding LacI/PurR family transcriptional regulator
MKATTIKDIGKKLGISHTTVSRAINGDTRISQVTRDRVTAAVKEMKYSPNMAARGLVRGKSNTIAVVAPSYFANFSVDVMRGIEPEMIKTKYDICYYTTSRYTTIGTQGKDQYIYEKILNEKRADAVIVLNGILMGDGDVLKRYKRAGIHLVHIEGRDSWGHRVHYDNERAAAVAVKHLVDTGRKKIGLLIGSYEWVESMKERHDGFKKAMQECTGKFDRESVFSFVEDFGDAVKNSLYHFIKNKVNAVYVGTGDEDAIKMINEAHKIGLKVPDDIAIIGQDDIRMAAVAGLTTIRQPITEMGQKAVEMAVSAIEQKEYKKMRDEIFYPELIIRKTT